MIRYGWWPFGNLEFNEGVRGPRGIGFKLSKDGNYDMENKKLTNLQNPVSENDAVTFKITKEIEKYIKEEFKKLENKDKRHDFQIGQVSKQTLYNKNQCNTHSNILQNIGLNREQIKNLSNLFSIKSKDIEQLKIDSKKFILKLKDSALNIKNEPTLLKFQVYSSFSNYFDLNKDFLIVCKETGIFKIKLLFFESPHHQKILEIFYGENIIIDIKNNLPMPGSYEKIENCFIDSFGSENRSLGHSYYKYSHILYFEKNKQLALMIRGKSGEKPAFLNERLSSVDSPEVELSNRLMGLYLIIKKIL